MKRIFCFSILLCGIFSVKAQNQQVEALEAEADTLLARENYAEALPLYNRIVNEHKSKAAELNLILYKRAVCQYSLQHFNEALQDINRLPLHDPAFYQANLLKAFIGRELNEPQVQLEALNLLLLLDSGNDELLRWRVSILLELDKYVEARKDIAVLKRTAGDAELDLFMGMSYYYENNPDSAIVYFDNAIAKDKTFATPYKYASLLCLEQDAYDLALQYLNAGIKLDPKNFSLIFYKGIAMVEQKKFTEGCRCLSKAFQEGVDDAGDYLKEYCYGIED